MVKTLLEVKELTKHFPVERGLISAITSKLAAREAKFIDAVSQVSFSINEGETLGLVGESGSGKSTVARCLLRLIEPTSGAVYFDGKDLSTLRTAELRALRAEMQIIFQDPFTSLNPRIKVGQILGHPMEIHGITHGNETERRVEDLLETVGLSPEHMNRYPHQFSGGQKQRIAVARALAVRPRFIVADEPVSALDVSIQAQILNLFQQLKEKLGLTYLFISHNLDVVEHISDRIAVMYLGRVVEVAEKNELFTNPLHPYTKALMSAMPIPDPKLKMERIILKGEVPDAIKPPTGCRFHTRCPYVMEVCKGEAPMLEDVGNHHYVACYLN